LGRRTRWLYHPHPEDGEALSSWITRIAACYRLRPQELVGDFLGHPGITADQLDTAPTEALLSSIEERTGVDTNRLRHMTVSGLPIWRMPIGAKSQVKSILLPRGTPIDAVPTETDAWLPRRLLRRACPACAARDTATFTPIAWRLPLVLSCADHACDLVSRRSVIGWPPATRPHRSIPVAADDAILVHDQRIQTALRGQPVHLPAGVVPAQTWLSAIHRVVDELTSSALLGQLPAPSRTALGLTPADRVTKRNLAAWRSFESLQPSRQLRTAAAAARVVLAIQTGELIPPGSSPVIPLLISGRAHPAGPTIFLTYWEALSVQTCHEFLDRPADEEAGPLDIHDIVDGFHNSDLFEAVMHQRLEDHGHPRCGDEPSHQ
jgi:hypothetical protein